MKRVTITSTQYHMHYCIFSLSLMRVGHNTTRYHNFNVLPHVLSYIFTQLSIVWGYFERVTTRQIYKKMYINTFLKKLRVTRGNTL